MSSHAARAAEAEVRVFRKSAGTLCTAPVAISFLAIFEISIISCCFNRCYYSFDAWEVVVFELVEREDCVEAGDPDDWGFEA